MKKLFSMLWTALFLLSVCGTVAFADVIDPYVIAPKKTVSPLPYVLIGVAVIVAAVLIWRTRKQKK